MTANAGSELHMQPISSRPRRAWWQVAHGLTFILVFFFACMMIHGSQLAFLLPLKLIPHPAARTAYYRGVRYSKGAFGSLLGACVLGSLLCRRH